MRNTQDKVKAPLEAEQDFAKFLKRVRKEENVYLEQLAEGLMTASQLARIEKGQRPIPKNMRDRLLGRLGIASDLYENLLNIEDYEAWECQRDILSAVERRETSRAWKLILAYENQTPDNDKVTQQFCLMMEAEVLKQQKVDQCDIASCYEKAAKCSIPDIGNLCLKKKLLSIQEINMILEYEFYHKDQSFSNQCKHLMTIVEKTVYDDLSKVKIYPKIVYYYLREEFIQHKEQTMEHLKENLRICNRAVEMLRDTGRAFYLLELLEIKIKLLDCIKEMQEDETLRLEYQECEALVHLFHKLYKQCDVSVYMQDCTYLYQQRWVFYIGDVLRIRRKMFGLTQKELCEGVCSVRTLRRAEKKEANMQHEHLEVLLRKIGLSKEFQRTCLITNDREVLRLRNEILTCRNNREYDKCRELLGQIQKKILLGIPENQQYVMELKASLDWMENKITREEFVVKEEEALRCTFKRKKLFYVDEIYLTEIEVLCIRKIIQGLECPEKEEYIRFLLRVCKINEKKCALTDQISMCEHVMPYIASELGNIEEYHTAIEIDRIVLREALMCRRIWVIGNVLYDILWNESEQEIKFGRTADKTKMAEGFKQSMLLSHFCKQVFNEKFYYEKIEALEK